MNGVDATGSVNRTGSEGSANAPEQGSRSVPGGAAARVRAALWHVPVGLQLSVLYTLLFVVSLSLLGWVIYSQIDGFLVRNTADRLQRTASSVLTRSIDFQRDDNSRGGGRRGGISVALPPPPFDDHDRQERMAESLVRELSAPDVTVAVLNTQGTVITSTMSFEGVVRELPTMPDGWLRSVDVPVVQDTLPISSQWIVPSSEGRKLVVVQAFRGYGPFANQQNLLLLQAASMDEADDILNQLGLLLVFGILIGTVAGVLVVLWLTRTVLRPLDKMARTAEAIASGDLNRRLLLPGGGNEVARLGGAFDHMVDRLAANLQAQRRFVANASHELRTPLTSLEGLSEMLLMGADRGDERAVQRMARSMHGELGRMARLVSDLLTLSRLDSAAAMTFSTLDAGSLIENVVEQMTPLAEGRGIALNATVEGPVPVLVSADPDRLKQVVLNLVDNALRYTPEGGEVRLTASQGGGKVRLQVEDTGPGIAPEDISYIFGRFYRGDPSRARTTGSTGLGLAIARSIMQAHGGTIEAHSNPGAGACFVVTLSGQRPGDKGPEAAPAPAADKAAYAPAGSSTGTQGSTIQ